MEKSVLQPSSVTQIFTLQNLCIIRISTNLCNGQELLSLITKCYFYKFFYHRLYTRKSNEYEAVQAKAKEIILRICNSAILCERILGFVWPTCYRIMVWNFTYGKFLVDNYVLNFHWTDRGRISNIKTVKHIIGIKNIPIFSRFRLACGLCLNKEIEEMWGEISKEDVKDIFSRKHDKFCSLITFWVQTMKGSEQVVEQHIQEALKCAIDNELIEAIKYLFKMLESDAKYHALKYDMVKLCMFELNEKLDMLGFLEEDEIDIGCFLLSQYEFAEENRETIHQNYGALQLSLLIHSSHQNFFKALQEEIEFCFQCHIFHVLLMIFYMYHLEITYHDNAFRSLFIDVWRAIPSNSKNYVATITDLGPFCVSVLIKHDFPFLLKEKAFEKVAELTSSNFKCCISDTPLGFDQGKWEFLYFLVEEGVVTIPNLKKYLKHFIKSDKSAVNRVLRFVRKIGKRKSTSTNE